MTQPGLNLVVSTKDSFSKPEFNITDIFDLGKRTNSCAGRFGGHIRIELWEGNKRHSHDICAEIFTGGTFDKPLEPEYYEKFVIFEKKQSMGCSSYCVS